MEHITLSDVGSSIMTQTLREFFVSRINAGYMRYKTRFGVLKLKAPTVDVEYEANELALELEQSLPDFYNEYEILSILKYYNIWTEGMDKDFEQAPKNLDKLKKELYNARLQSNLQKKIRLYIQTTRQEYTRLLNIRHSWDHFTSRGIANFARLQYIVYFSTFLQDKLYDWTDISTIQVMNYLQRNILSDTQIRDIVKHEPWNNIWTTRKTCKEIFAEPMTEEQRRVIAWSKLYDNVHESHDCPEEDVIDDDDMLDGWLLIKREEQDKERNKIAIDNKVGRQGQEVYIPVNTPEDAQKVYAINHPYAASIIRNRNEAAKDGPVTWGALPDINQRMKMEAAQKISQRTKGMR